MPRIFYICGYCIYFWSNEGCPLEPVHIHVFKGRPNPNATKIWITKSKKCLICNNDSRISAKLLNNMVCLLEARVDDILKKWDEHFGQMEFYC